MLPEHRERPKASFGMRSAPSIKAVLESHANRGPGFDTVRLVAASAVVLHHATEIQFDKVRDDWLFQITGGYTHLGLLAVSVFFVISGFLVTPGLVKTGNVLEFLSRRFMRIMPLLATVVVLTAIVVGPALTTLPLVDYFKSELTWKYLINITTSLRLELPGVLNYNGTSAINSPLWTLRFEWICYLAIAVFSIFSLLRSRSAFLVSWLCSQIAFVLIYGFPAVDQPLGVIGTLLYLFGYFGGGVALFLYGDRIRFSWGWIIAAFAALAVTIWLGVPHPFAPALIAYLAICVGLLRMPWSDMLSKVDLSYGVYLMHVVVMIILMRIFEFESVLAFFVAGLAFSIVAASLSWFVIEKPALRHKSLPASIARNSLGRLALGRWLVRRMEHPDGIKPNHV